MKIWRKFKNAIMRDWQGQRGAFLLEAYGVPAGLVAASLISFYTDSTPFILVYTLFLSCSVALTVAAWIRGATFLVVLNLFYTVINVIGLVKSIAG